MLFHEGDNQEEDKKNEKKEGVEIRKRKGEERRW